MNFKEVIHTEYLQIFKIYKYFNNMKLLFSIAMNIKLWYLEVRKLDTFRQGEKLNLKST